MIAGLILKDNLEEDSYIAFLGDELESFSVTENSEIVELIEERDPDIIAANVGLNQGKEELNKQEKELKEEGHIFTPNSHKEKTIKRLDALKAQINQELGLTPDFIRFDPNISARELAIDGDEALSSYGVDPSGIGSAGEFDAVIGCITARFYQENQYEEHGVVVPQPMREKDETESEEELDPRIGDKPKSL